MANSFVSKSADDWLDSTGDITACRGGMDSTGNITACRGGMFLISNLKVSECASEARVN